MSTVDCSSYSTCCYISTYSFSFLNFKDIHLFNLILAVGIFVASVFIIYKLLRNIIYLNERVNFERNYLINGLKDAQAEDLVIISDVDEIPNLKFFSNQNNFNNY